MKNFEIIILSIIFTFLTAINSKILTFFWIPEVNWNYEFTKVISFNIIFSIFSIFFFIKNFKKSIYIPKVVYIIFWIFWLTSIFSNYPLTNIFWNNFKGHWLIFAINLLILFSILINFERNKLEKLVKFIVFQSPIIFILAVIWYIFWWQENNIWFLWYPNYIALYSLLLSPFILKKIKFNILNKNEKIYNFLGLKIVKWKKLAFLYWINFILLIITLFLTKSFFSIITFILYFWFFLHKNLPESKKNIKYLILFILSSFLFFTIYKVWIKQEINNIISKIFIWESTYKSISWNILTSLFWIWNDSLIYVFESFKSKYLYIFENIWFNVDRSSNIFLHIFYSFWLVWLIFFINILSSFLKNYDKNSASHQTIILFLSFSLFNFVSVVNYFYIAIIIAIICSRDLKILDIKTKIFFILLSFFSIFTSIFYYYEETKFLKNNKYESSNIVYKSLKLEDKEKEIIKNNSDIFKMCENLLKINKSAESFFYCWNFFWEVWYHNLAKVYYNEWIKKVPNLWDPNSKYFDNIFVKYLYSKEKFFDIKYSNIKQILERIKK